MNGELTELAGAITQMGQMIPMILQNVGAVIGIGIVLVLVREVLEQRRRMARWKGERL